MQENVEYKIINDEYKEMSNWNIAKNAYKLLFKNFNLSFPFIIPFALYFAASITSLIFSAVTKNNHSASPIIVIGLLFIIFYCGIVGFWKQMRATLVTVRNISKLMRGESFETRLEMDYVNPRTMGFLGLNLILFLIYIIINAICFIVGYVMSQGNMVMMIFVLLAALIMAAFTWIYTAFATPIYALSNDIDGLRAINNSFKIMTESKMGSDLLIAIFFAGLFMIIPYIILAIIPVIGALMTSVINSIMMPVVNIAVITHLYLKAISRIH